MKFGMEFTPIPLENLHREAAVMKTEGWRFIQTHAVNTDNGIDLYYSFMKDGLIRNLKVEGVTKEQSVPSVTDMFLAAFVFENEARELFNYPPVENGDIRAIRGEFKNADKLMTSEGQEVVTIPIEEEEPEEPAEQEAEDAGETE